MFGIKLGEIRKRITALPIASLLVSKKMVGFDSPMATDERVLDLALLK